MRKKFFVAIHTTSDFARTKDQVEKVLTNDGAYGVILVNNSGQPRSHIESNPSIFEFAMMLKSDFKGYTIGVNPLGISTETALRTTPQRIDVLWTDDGGIDEINGKAELRNSLVDPLKAFRPQYFGSIAFKHQKQPDDLVAVAREAAKHFSAVITSGDETGVPPTIEKMKLLAHANIGKPIGIASGITYENIMSYMPYADIFIIGTSVTDNDFYTYSAEKVKKLRKQFDLVNSSI